MRTCDDRWVAPQPHTRAYSRAGYDPRIRLCAACWHDALGENEGDRYQPRSISGWTITGDRFAETGSNTRMRTTWYVQDRCYGYRPVRRYDSSARRGDALEQQRRCLRECARLNRDERRWMAA